MAAANTNIQKNKKNTHTTMNIKKKKEEEKTQLITS